MGIQFNFKLLLDSQKKKYIREVVVVAGSCSLPLVLIVACVCLLFIKRRKRSNHDERTGNSIDLNLNREAIPRRFFFRQLFAATTGFPDDKKLGTGGSGQVYKGVLNDRGRVVAVKRFFSGFENSERVFINEERIISRLIHRNLVQFIGRCHENGEFLLVYDYMPNGSLDTHLFVNRRIGRASKESDMYSFGVVALEIACGRRTCQEGNVVDAADEGLRRNFDVNEMICLLIVGLWCTHPIAKERPKAARVVKVLQLESPLPVLPPDMHNFSDFPPNHVGQSNSFGSQPITSSLANDGR